MPSKVVRFVFDEKVSYTVLKNFIEERVSLTGNIKNVYTRKCVPLDIGYAYVIFELTNDAEKIVDTLNGVEWEDGTIKASLIGPDKEYKLYMHPQARGTIYSQTDTNLITLKKRLPEMLFKKYYTYKPIYLPKNTAKQQVRNKLISERNEDLTNNLKAKPLLNTVRKPQVDPINKNKLQDQTKTNPTTEMKNDRFGIKQRNINSLLQEYEKRFSVQERLSRLFIKK